MNCGRRNLCNTGLRYLTFFHYTNIKNICKLQS